MRKPCQFTKSFHTLIKALLLMTRYVTLPIMQSPLLDFPNASAAPLSHALVTSLFSIRPVREHQNTKRPPRSSTAMGRGRASNDVNFV